MMIHVAYSGNKGVFEGIMLSVLSMIKNSKHALHIHILTMDMSDQKPHFLPISQNQVEILDAVLKKVNPESLATRVDLTDIYNDTLRKGKNNKTEYTPYALIRLYLDVIPSIPDKIIYLDMDTMCVKDINELYSVDVSDYEFGASLDYMGKFWMGKTYTNSGVMLLNMQAIRESKLFEKSRDILMTRLLKMPDQSAMNMFVKKKLILPMKFNEQRDIKPETIIKHFNKGIKYFPFFHIYNYKQWHRDKVHKKLKIFDFDDIYEQYDELAKVYDFKK